jgi:hypothetical protein
MHFPMLRGSQKAPSSYLVATSDKGRAEIKRSGEPEDEPRISEDAKISGHAMDVKISRFWVNRVGSQHKAEDQVFDYL